jgi:hypothetical protein
MKILEKIKSRKLSKTLAAVVAGGFLFFSAGDALADSNAEFKFREAYLSEAQNTRIFNQNIDFFSNTFYADADSQGKVLRDGTMQISGRLNWAYTNPSNNMTINKKIPFYITQQGNSEMTLHVQRNGKWNKFVLPGMPSSFVNALSTTDHNILQENMKAVRNVELFRETNAQQIFDIALDGQYLAQLMADYSYNRTDISDEERANHEDFSRNLQAALKKKDLHCTWTFDKINHRTVTIVIDFTDLLRDYSINVLNEAAAGKFTLTEEDKMLFEAIGYYSECHYTLSYYNGDEDRNYAPSAEAQKASENRNIFNDLVREMVTTVQK